MRFLYLRDPLFLACVATYFVNRFVLKNIWHDGFVHAHLNDLICIPFWVPIMLFAQRTLRLRPDDHSPRPAEIIIASITTSENAMATAVGISRSNRSIALSDVKGRRYTAVKLMDATAVVSRR